MQAILLKFWSMPRLPWQGTPTENRPLWSRSRSPRRVNRDFVVWLRQKDLGPHSLTGGKSFDFAAGKMMENAPQWWMMMDDRFNKFMGTVSRTQHEDKQKIFASQNSGQWRWQKTICWESLLSLYSKQKGCCMKHLIVLKICQLFQTSRFRFAESI